MALYAERQRTKSNWTPVSYTANETTAVMPVAAGEEVTAVEIRVNTAFDGTNSDATISIGDSDDADRFVTTADAGVTSTGIKQGTGGSGSVFTAIGRHLYTADDTIDVAFVADTGADGSAGSVDILVRYRQRWPH